MCVWDLHWVAKLLLWVSRNPTFSLLRFGYSFNEVPKQSDFLRKTMYTCQHRYSIHANTRAHFSICKTKFVLVLTPGLFNKFIYFRGKLLLY